MGHIIDSEENKRKYSTEKITEKICLFIHLLVGSGAMAGGLAAITDPHNPMGANAAEMLKYSPFSNFLIPGLLLFCVIGLGNIFAALSFLRNWKLRAFISGFFASALILWIFVQCVMLQGVVVLHIIFIIIGVIQGFLALILICKRIAREM